MKSRYHAEAPNAPIDLGEHSPAATAKFKDCGVCSSRDEQCHLQIDTAPLSLPPPSESEMTVINQ